MLLVFPLSPSPCCLHFLPCLLALPAADSLLIIPLPFLPHACLSPSPLPALSLVLSSQQHKHRIESPLSFTPTPSTHRYNQSHNGKGKERIRRARRTKDQGELGEFILHGSVRWAWKTDGNMSLVADRRKAKEGEGREST